MTSSKQISKKLPGTHRLLAQSLNFIRLHVRKLGPVLLTTTLVNAFLFFVLNGYVRNLYQGLWFILSSCALIWTIRHLEDKSTAVTLKKVFYEGTSPFLRFFLTLMLVAIMSIPFSVGAFIYAAVNVLMAAGPVLAQQILVGIIWIGFSLVSLFILARTIFSLIIVTLPELTPIKSFRLSWRLTKGNTNALVVRLFIALIYIFLITLMFILLLSAARLNNQIAFLTQIFVSLFVMPMLYVYTYKLYRGLT